MNYDSRVIKIGVKYFKNTREVSNYFNITMGTAIKRVKKGVTPEGDIIRVVSLPRGLGKIDKKERCIKEIK